MPIYVFFIAWVILACLVGWVAAKRGRSALIWTFLSMILSPSVLAILIALPQKIRA